ncbi:sodium/pantothenate symporter [Moritella sp.]|uniref:sodium/pantothenate symporter n=1 Tax=Moritella sp. TaxID=78556 RepID=UPI001D9F5985|nr:sodium/pantothenate symporter [Moritella sp.]MCJ8352244.1 sodium/pantothenate symporter [Moritella sp.]NQZ42525.1 sodium/pantothenate symporter [Moritella sp.]
MTNLIPILIYLVASLLVTRWWSARQEKQSGDLYQDKAKRFFIGGRFLNGPLLALTLVATYTSASSFIGGPGAAYKIGLGWVWLALIQVPVAMLTLGVLGPKLLAQRKAEHATLIEWLDARYQNSWLTQLALVSLVVGFIAMISVQFIGGARLFSGVSGISYELGLGLFVITVLAYTLTGGFRAVVITDAFQGILMIVGVLVIFLTLLSQGGLTALMADVSAQSPTLLSPQGNDGQLGWPMMLSFWMLICFGTLGLPHTVVRLLAVKDTNALKRGMIWGTIISFLMTLIPHLSGVLGRALYPDLTVPDEIMPKLITGLFDPFWAGVLLAAPIAAVMSSVDSMLLQSAVSLVRDGVVRCYPRLTADKQVTLTRVAMLLVTLIATYFAIEPPDMIVWLNLAAFGALQAVFLWPILAGLYWPQIAGNAALAAMVSGLVSYLVLLWLKPAMFGIHPIVPALLISVFSMLAVHRIMQMTVSQKA